MFCSPFVLFFSASLWATYRLAIRCLTITLCAPSSRLCKEIDGQQKIGSYCSNEKHLVIASCTNKLPCVLCSTQQDILWPSRSEHQFHRSSCRSCLFSYCCRLVVLKDYLTMKYGCLYMAAHFFLVSCF